jgi:hypothetical protein
MSSKKAKSPQEKKKMSLAKDRRNIYGECPTSSRKNIKRGKQRSHMEQRRAVTEELRAIKGPANEVDADRADIRALDRLKVLARYSFKKKPDAPLAVALERKAKRRSKIATPRKSS